MGRISASTGLNSGIDIQGTVTKLVAIDAKPRDTLTAANTGLQTTETALSTISAYLLSVQSITNNLAASSSVFTQQTAATSNPAVLNATVTGTPTAGTYQYTVLQTAQSGQYISSGLTSATNPLGAGTLTYRFGPTVTTGASLSNINGGTGFSAGKIRITDRSGASAQVDLSSAQNIDDVIQAINSAGSINITASAVDGHLQLTDNTGQTASDLKVQEVGSGTTAASLGLNGIDVAGNTASGANIYKLSSNLQISALNDGSGIGANSSLPDIAYTLHDGTSGTIDLSPIVSGSSAIQRESTLGDVINEISTQSGGKLQATVSNDGQSLVITDGTAGANPSGTLTISDSVGSTAATDLGIVVNAVSGGSVTGNRIIGGLKTVLLSSLNGGQGTGTLGYIKLTDKNGNSANVNLTGSETLQDVVTDINSQIQAANSQPGAQTVGITAVVNQAGNGIQLVDTTGAASGTLTAANSDAASDGSDDGTNSAVKLGFATASGPGSTTSNTLNSGDLHLRVVSRGTALNSLNGGAGVQNGQFSITDSTGALDTVTVSGSTQNIGDVIDSINRSGVGVRASINANGDGILLTGTAGGTGTLKVTEGGSTTAHDLNLLTTATTTGGTQTIDGSTTHSITLSATDTLTDLQNKINALGGGLSAGIINDGSGTPYRLSLTDSQTGRAGNVVVDASQIGSLSLQQVATGQNALLSLSNGSSSAPGLIVSSSTNTFTGILPGVSLQAQSASSQPVTVSISSSDSQIATNLQVFVTNYNQFRKALNSDTTYDTTTNTAAVLFGDFTGFQLDTQLSRLVNASFGSGTGPVKTLANVGISVQSDGTLIFNQSVLDSAWASNSAAVTQFFSATNTGLSDQFKTTINQLAGNNNSSLATRLTSIQTQITDNQTQISQMTQRLNDETNNLYNQYYAMDLAIGKLKNAGTVIGSLSILDPYTGPSSSSTGG